MGERLINPILNVHEEYRKVNIINSYRFGGGLNPSAQAFIDAAGITNPTQVTAINTLVNTLITTGVWAKLGAVWPFVGGTASTHKYNLKDPRDLDAAYRLVFFNSPTHNANGVTWNGTNQYADTFFVPASVLSGFSAHMSYYSRIATPSGNYFMGSFNSGGEGMEIQYNSGAIYSDTFGNSTGRTNFTSSALGLITISRTAINDHRIYRNSSQLVLSTSNNTAGAPPAIYKLVLGARNSSGVIQRWINAPCSWASIGQGLTPAQALDYSNAVAAFQTSLGRAV